MLPFDSAFLAGGNFTVSTAPAVLQMQRGRWAEGRCARRAASCSAGPSGPSEAGQTDYELCDTVGGRDWIDIGNSFLVIRRRQCRWNGK